MVQKNSPTKPTRFSVNCDAELSARFNRFRKKEKRKKGDAVRFLIERGLEAEGA